MSLSYKKSGVDYSLLDPVKKMAQLAGLKTAKNITDTSYKELSKSRGETAYIIEARDCYYALVEECLGTKSIIADEMNKLTGKTYYEAIAQDTVAMIVNDLATVGARPLTVLAYWAVGDSKWWSDKKRAKQMVWGWRKACDLAGATWGAGETPSMNDVVLPNRIDLAGAAFGIIQPKKRLITGDNLKAGDIIIMFESSGVHANGISLTRKIADIIPGGYKEKLSNQKMYGEELLKPTTIYCKLIEELITSNIDIHYMINITGHGWRKLMRARQAFSYVIEKIPPPSQLFTFIQKYSGLSDYDMYSTFNMGAGFAVFVSPDEVNKVFDIAKEHNIKTWIAGRVERGPKKVVIKPLNITYDGRELNLR